MFLIARFGQSRRLRGEPGRADHGTRSQSLRSAFTLVELLVVIVIIAILMGMLMPAISSVREAARMTQCKNRLRQIGLAIHSYEGAQRCYPPGWVSQGSSDEPGWGWASVILPEMEEKAIDAALIHRLMPIEEEDNRRARESILPMFLCPSDPTEELVMLREGSGHHHGDEDDHDDDHPPALHDDDEDDHGHEHEEEGEPLFSVARANFAGVFGTQELHDAPGSGNGMFFRNSRIQFRHVSDGLSKTLFVGERSSKLGASIWVGVVPEAAYGAARIVGSADHPPNSVAGHFDDFSSHHPRGAHFLLGDGAVLMIGNDVDEVVYRAMATRAGGEFERLEE